MATLQAARAYVLGLSYTESVSWGLNRAIFYAVAKRGFKGTRITGKSSDHEAAEKLGQREVGTFFLGDEMAYRAEGEREKTFIIGGKHQTEEDFKRQIESRFGGRFTNTWKEAVGIMKNYGRETLLSQREFYEKVYEPRRDKLAKKWTPV